MTYGELDKRANQLAHRLVALGVGPEVPVGVMIPRSLHVMVALLGVLKAGGAYVPMDPSYPPDRLAIMLEDSEACAALRWMFCKTGQAASVLHDSVGLSSLVASQAPVLLSLEETYAQTAIPCAARVLLVRELTISSQPMLCFAVLSCFSAHATSAP